MVRAKDISATFGPDQWGAPNRCCPRARHTRDLAKSATTRTTIEKLEEIARGYDRRAKELEVASPPKPLH
jgi:hypothetical protein